MYYILVDILFFLNNLFNLFYISGLASGIPDITVASGFDMQTRREVHCALYRLILTH